MSILRRPRPSRQRVDDDQHDPQSCGWSYKTDCRSCRAARDEARADDPSYRYSEWRWQTRQTTGHDPQELSNVQREALRNLLIDLVATAGTDTSFAAEVGKLFRALFAYTRRASK